MAYSRCAALAFAVLSLMDVRLRADSTSPMPPRFEFKFDRAPIWVAASEAIAPDGSVRAGVLRPTAREELSRRHASEIERRARTRVTTNEAETCDVAFAGVMAGDAAEPGAKTLDDLRDVVAGRSVISGRVAASAVGLHAGMPYTVLQIETDRSEDSAAYLLYPAGRMRFEGMTVCNRDASYPELPVAGDVITFVTGPAIDHTGRLFTASGSWIFYDHDGATTTPPGFNLSGEGPKAPTAQELAKLLRSNERSNDKRQ